MTMTPCGAVVTNIQVSNGPSGWAGKSAVGPGRAGHYSHASSLYAFPMTMTPCRVMITNKQVSNGPSGGAGPGRGRAGKGTTYMHPVSVHLPCP